MERRRPMVGIAFVFLAGVMFCLTGAGRTQACMAGICGFLCLLAIPLLASFSSSGPRRAGRRWQHFLLYAGIFCSGYFVAFVNGSGAEAGALRRLAKAARAGEPVHVSGRVSGGPGKPRQLEQDRRMWSFGLEIRELLSPGNSSKVRNVSMSCNVFGNKNDSLRLRPGQRLEMHGTLRILPPLTDREAGILFSGDPAPPGLRRVAARLRNRLYMSGDIHESGLTVLRPDFMERMYRCRQSAAEILATGVEGSQVPVSVAQALLLGYREQVPEQVRKLFAETGTLHVFAISGLHVGLVAGMVIFILSAAGVARDRWVWFLGPLLAVYIMATGAQASAVRAGIMAVAYFLAYPAGRKGDPLSAVAASAALIVGFAPGQLLSPGFIFSFVVVSGLIVIYPVLHAPFTKMFRADPLRLQRESRPANLCRRAGLYFSSLAALSVTAFAVSSPLTAYFFQRISPAALLGNLAVVPLAFFIVLTASLSFVTGSVFLLAADIFNHANLVFTTLLVGTVGGLRELPFSTLDVGRPPVILVAGWYCGLCAMVFYVKRRKKE